MNIYSGLINSNFKNIFNQAIDALLEDGALSVPCRLRFSNQTSSKLCNNCVFDTISNLSSNMYNQSGPNPFPDGSICPVCLGVGIYQSTSAETVYLACIFDSKYWLNWSSKSINIPNGMVQTICNISLISKLRNVSDMSIDTNISDYGNYSYERAGDPEPVGLGDNRYIITMWKRK